MRKEFYSGQPLVIKKTGERVTFIQDDGHSGLGCSVLEKDSGRGYICYYEYEKLEPSTEFNLSQIIAGLEQGYFDVWTEFRMPSANKTIKVRQGNNGLCLESYGGFVYLLSRDINSTWQLVEPRKEMTLEEIEAELGYKVKLKDSGEK